ncbi:hypothetical protein L1987_08390 [Smallanthus sonchifolius]|uniref:Uncharacterized protein n=1 Tax=Smallanthus sonchifolius TaxID=185202 RepID=A0ACB9JM90_9ASTR|nr:hypothetical protein L1987_08390 [Smallanthus sonchifolius]
MNIVRVKGMPILQQLEIEECLLRTSSDNCCIINDGADKPTIVMGVSGIYYLLSRDHLDFICPMKDYLSRSDFISKTIDAAGSHFSVESTEFEAVKPPSNMKFTPTSRLLTNQELEAAYMKANV